MTAVPGESRTILVVVPSLGRGGAERTVSRLTQEWSRNHTVVVAVFNASLQVFPHGGSLADLAAPATAGGLTRMLTGLRRVFRLRRLMRSMRPDHVFAFMESANIPVILAALLASYRHRVTLSVRGNPGRMAWFHKAAAFCLYGLAARIVVVSEGAARRLSGIAPACARKMTVIYSPLPIDEINAAVSENPGPRAVPWFFAAGRLVPGKAFDRMIRIFAQTGFPKGAEAELWIAGDGPERGLLESIIARNGLSGRVRLVGAVENPCDYMKNAVAFLMTSEHEGFPVVLIEALACGCPVIAFDCDFGPREVTRDGEAGFIVPLGPDERREEERFAARLSQLIGDPLLRERMSLAARTRARDFEIGKVAAQWLPSRP